MCIPKKFYKIFLPAYRFLQDVVISPVNNFLLPHLWVFLRINVDRIYSTWHKIYLERFTYFLIYRSFFTKRICVAQVSILRQSADSIELIITDLLDYINFLQHFCNALARLHKFAPVQLELIVAIKDKSRQNNKHITLYV